jgi:beta-phosphoglucomutase-like phosphatase (HAD superfamily)
MLPTIIFDFDGLILDTETSALQSWQEIYQSYHVDLPVENGCLDSAAQMKFLMFTSTWRSVWSNLSLTKILSAGVASAILR